MKRVFRRLDVRVDDNTFIAHQLAPRVVHRGIIVQFDNRIVRDELLKKGKSLKLSVSDFDNNYPKALKKLLYDLRKMNESKGFEYIWFTNSKILVTKTRGSRSISVLSIQKFERL